MPPIRTRLLVLTCVVAAATAGVSSAAVTPAAGVSPASISTVSHTDLPGLSRLAAAGPTIRRAIVTFDKVPTAAQVSALRSLGLTVQPMRALPLALVAGPVAALVRAAGVGNDVYPDETLTYSDTASSNAMSSSTAGAARLRARGFTGKGVTVGIVDSGCDGTHPDLADHIDHNVTLVSPEYVNAGTTPQLVVPADQGPFSNTDLGSGHGTHVAGIIAADGTTDPSHLGVAPDAELVCLGIGEVLFTTAVVTAYDHLLDQPDLWGVDVINNSWGNSYQQFDPRNPVAVDTKAVADLGVTVVFAAGNSGSGNGEATLNPFSQAPWVISVAAGTVKRQRGDFSSNGLLYDNSQPVTIGAGGHTTFSGHRIGVVHPDITGPGVDISSSCDTAGSVVGPCPPGENTEASGTSMASPHIAGAAAVLLQAQPKLTPSLIRDALQATASPVVGTADEEGTPTALGFWQVGYGYVEVDDAAALVKPSTFARDITRRQAAADQRVLRSTDFAVNRSDLWTYDAPRVTLGGSDSRTYTAPVASSTTLLKVTLVHPSLGTVGVNGFEHVVTVKDAKGKVLGTTTEHDVAGCASVLLDLRKLGAAYGTFTFEVAGQLAVSDPDTLDSDSVNGDTITFQVAQLTPTR